MLSANPRFKLLLGDITAQDVDLVVNAANQALCGGGGVDGAIHRPAGPELLALCRTLGGCATGQAKTTPGFGLLADYIVHTPGPVWEGGHRGEEALLEQCYRSCFFAARDLPVASMAFPCISTGAYRFPMEKAVRIALAEIERGLIENPSLHEVRVVCFSEKDRRAYERGLRQLEGAALDGLGLLELYNQLARSMIVEVPILAPMHRVIRAVLRSCLSRSSTIVPTRMPRWPPGGASRWRRRWRWCGPSRRTDPEPA